MFDEQDDYFVYCDGLGRLYLYLYLYLYLFVFICCVFVLLPIFSVNKDLYNNKSPKKPVHVIGLHDVTATVGKTPLWKI